MNANLARLWTLLLQIFDLLVLARVPILMVLAGFLMSFYVPQIQELFDISLSKWVWASSAFVFTAGLSVLVWLSARTLYSFQWPHWQTSAELQQWWGLRLPRLLAAGGPATLALAYFLAGGDDDSSTATLWSLAYLVLAIAVWLLATHRRRLLRLLTPAPLRQRLQIDAQSKVALLQHWRELGRLRYLHYAGLIALPTSWAVGLYFPHLLDGFGPIALILGAAAFTVWASTYLVYLAARARFPLLSGLMVWAVLMTALGQNDNHAVRFTYQQQSDQDPPKGLHYAPDQRPTLANFMRLWWSEQRQIECDGKAWLISSEGGGIRAAMWTVLVLSELHAETDGKLWHCTLATSGVSGGSLGLAVFASAYRDHRGELGSEQRKGMVQMLETDFLAPVLGAMFGVDGVQRFLPFRLFSDRGEALENSWVRAYAKHVSPTDVDTARPATSPEYASSSLAGPLADTAFARDSQRTPLPALLLNTTIVDSGMRLIQHPFSELTNRKTADVFPGVVDGSDWLPRELPTFSAAHNSARFTLVSPAGTVHRRAGESAEGAITTLGQVVDGGYFENSATTTIEALLQRFGAGDASQAPELRVIHISNDVGVAAFASNKLDLCPQADAVALDTPRDAPVAGEARAPLLAILATRDARGEFARQSLQDRVTQLGRAQLWHYRLCKGRRLLPLGWTLGAESSLEMRRQLQGDGHDQAANLRQTTQQIVAQTGKPSDPAP